MDRAASGPPDEPPPSPPDSKGKGETRPSVSSPRGTSRTGSPGALAARPASQERAPHRRRRAAAPAAETLGRPPPPSGGEEADAPGRPRSRPPAPSNLPTHVAPPPGQRRSGRPSPRSGRGDPRPRVGTLSVEETHTLKV